MNHPPLILALLLAALAGCASQGDSKTVTALRNPASLGELNLALPTGTPSVSGEYWQQLGDPQLDALIAKAWAEAPSLQLADARIRRAAALTQLADSAREPQLNANFDSTSQRFTENGMIPAPVAGSWRTNNRLALDAGIDLDLWGRYRAGLKSAEALLREAEVEKQAAKLALASALARGWVEYDRLYRQLDHLDALITTRGELENLQRIRVKAGLDPDFDRSQQRFGIAALRTERAATLTQLALQRDRLMTLAGQSQAEDGQLGRPQIRSSLDARLPSQLPADLLGNRPDVLASRWRVEAASHDIEAARAQFYPNVNLTAFLGFSSLGLENLLDSHARILGGGPAIRLPIFEGGRLRANLATRNADHDAAVAQYNATLLDALHEVVDQARSLEGMQQQNAMAREALTAAERGVQLTQTRVERRLASRVQLLGAQLQVLAQQRVLTNLHARRLDAALGLQRALGGGFSPDANPFTLAAN
ncbi:MAG: fusaric acid resistance protein [Candidatus Dactylopiibacterium carminicum]|nr:MAG: fusaric acid resistance protein [Candidatus Dactylopiibacterium carminicum]